MHHGVLYKMEVTILYRFYTFDFKHKYIQNDIHKNYFDLHHNEEQLNS